MRFLLALSVLAATVLAPSVAHASSSARVTTVELRAAGHGRFVAAGSVGRFTLAGVRWHGSGAVRFSTRSPSGRWGPWRGGQPEPEDDT